MICLFWITLDVIENLNLFYDYLISAYVSPLSPEFHEDKYYIWFDLS